MKNRILSKQEMVDSINQADELKVDTIRDLAGSLKSQFVFAAIDIGDVLLLLKDRIEHGCWTSFVKENIGISLRTCQDYMRLAKNPIHKNHYHLGSQKLLYYIKEDIDLSQSVLPSEYPFCEGCDGYKPDDPAHDCLCGDDNKDGSCPCSNCDDKSDCTELCGSWYKWEETSC